MRDAFKGVEVGVVSVDGVKGRRFVYGCRLWSVVGSCCRVGQLATNPW